MDLANIPSERSHTWKAIYYMILLLWNVHNRQTHGDRKWISDSQGIGGRHEWGMRYEVQGIFMNWGKRSGVKILMIVAQCLEYIKNEWNHLLKYSISYAKLYTLIG